MLNTCGERRHQKFPDAHTLKGLGLGVGFEHERSAHRGSAVPAHKSMPAFYRVVALTQRWLMDTHHGAGQPSEIDYYLGEFAFRFNCRSSGSRGLLCYRLLRQGG